MLDAVHRDDLPPEVLAGLSQQFPGMKIVCAGDAPGALPGDVAEFLEELDGAHARSMKEGRCIDCDEVMPGYPVKEVPDDWEPAEGWTYFTELGGSDPIAWQCPKCDAIESLERDT